MPVKKTLIILCVLLSIQIAFTKGNDDRGSDKDNKNRNGNNNDNSRHEMEKDRDINNDSSRKNRKGTREENINYNLTKSVDIVLDVQSDIKILAKGIKKENQTGITDKLINIKEGLGEIDNYKIDLLALLDSKEKDEIKSQIIVIEESQNRSKNIIGQINNELLNDFKNDEKLLSQINELEKEVNKIERQFRAIEWILTEN